MLNHALQVPLEPETQRPLTRPYGVPSGRPARRLRTRLQQRRPHAIRRHALRWLVRVSAMLAGDLAAAALVGAVVAGVGRLAEGLPGWAPAAALGAQAYGWNLVFASTLVLSLLVTGNYGRRGGSHSSVNLLRASVLASALTFWGTLPESGPVALAIPFAVGTSLIWAVLRVGRSLTTAFLAGVWPGARGAAAAIFVGSEGDFEALAGAPTVGAWAGYRLVGYLAARPGVDGALGSLPDLPELIDQHAIETIVVGGELSNDDLAMLLDVSITAGCELLCSARSIQIAGARPKLVWREEQPYFELGAPVLKAHAFLLKRIVDVVGATLGLVLVAPVILAITVAIKLDSAGPVLFTQHRAGLAGRRFRMLKFRTMHQGADEQKASLAHLNATGDQRLFKIEADPRVTAFGAWLRRWSLDELPQLWNVLRGDMSLVGPRPFFETDLDDYEDHHFRRLGAKPGITGLWQVSGRSSVVDFEEVVRLDREYIEAWSLLLDVRILLRTVPAVLGRRGAY